MSNVLVSLFAEILQSPVIELRDVTWGNKKLGVISLQFLTICLLSTGSTRPSLSNKVLGIIVCRWIEIKSKKAKSVQYPRQVIAGWTSDAN